MSLVQIEIQSECESHIQKFTRGDSLISLSDPFHYTHSFCSIFGPSFHSHSPSPSHCIRTSLHLTETIHSLPHTHNLSHFTPFSVHFLSQGQKPFNQAILPSSAPHLEKQHQGTLQGLQHQFCFKGFSFLILCSLMLFIFMLNLCKHEV